MKQIFSKSDDVIHLFAQQTQYYAANSSRNIYFYDNKIYSFGSHYLLGEFIDKKTILINDKGYSVTTSKHICSLKYATRQYKQFYTTQTDLNSVLNSFKELFEKWTKARKPLKYSGEINSTFDKLNEFIKHTNKKCKTDKRYIEIRKIHKSVNNNDIKELETYRKNKAKNERLKLKRQFTNKLKDFNNYKINSIRLKYNDKDYLRISQCGNFVETTQNVKIQIKEAQKLYKMILAGKDIKGYKIGYYTVIGLNGVLKIGCHNIDKNNMHEIGEKITTL
jgi:hypothetical protein